MESEGINLARKKKKKIQRTDFPHREQVKQRKKSIKRRRNSHETTLQTQEADQRQDYGPILLECLVYHPIELRIRFLLSESSAC